MRISLRIVVALLCMTVTPTFVHGDGPSGDDTTFSPTILSWYPTIQEDVKNKTAADLYPIFDKLTKWNEETDSPLHKVEDSDIAHLVHLLTEKKFEGLGWTEIWKVVATCGGEKKTISIFGREKVVHVARWRRPLPSTAKDIRGLLTHQDTNVVATAAASLAQMGANEYWKDIVPLLDWYGAHWSALWALARMNVPESAPALLPYLKKHDADFRADVVRILGRMKHPETATALQGMLTDSDARIRGWAAVALAGMEKKDLLRPELAADIEATLAKNAPPEDHERARRVLNDMKTTPPETIGVETVKKNIADLRSDDIQVRERATRELLKTGKDGRDLLQRASTSDDPEVRGRVEKILKILEITDKARFSEQFLLFHPDIYEQLAGAPGKKERQRLIMTMLAKPHPLEKQNPWTDFLDEESVAQMIRLLATDGYDGLEHQDLVSIVTLPQIGLWPNRLRSAARWFLPLLRHQDTGIAESAWTALFIMKATEVVPDVLPMLGDPNPTLRRRAVECLTYLRADALDTHIPALLNDADAGVRASAASAVRASGGEKHLPRLTPLLKDPDAVVRAHVISKIGEMTFSTEERNKYRTLLTPFLKDSSDSVRYCAVDALANLAAKESQEDLIPMLRDKDRSVRCAAVRAFSNMGVDRVQDKLIAGLKDTDPHIRVLSACVLAQCGKNDLIDRGVVEDFKTLFRSGQGYMPLMEDALRGMGYSSEEIFKMCR